MVAWLAHSYLKITTHLLHVIEIHEWKISLSYSNYHLFIEKYEQ